MRERGVPGGGRGAGDAGARSDLAGDGRTAEVVEAAEILGISDRQMRRWKRRDERRGYDGLFDRRRRRPSPKRVPVKTVRQVLTLYRERYHDCHGLHCHEKLQTVHGSALSYI